MARVELVGISLRMAEQMAEFGLVATQVKKLFLQCISQPFDTETFHSLGQVRGSEIWTQSLNRVVVTRKDVIIW